LVKKRRIKSRNPEREDQNFMILDTETADLNGDIIQLAYIIVNKEMNIIKTVNKYIKDRIPTVQTIDIHKITVDKLKKNGEDFYSVMTEFIKDLENVNYIVGHNVGYDLRAIINNLRKFELKVITNNKINTNIFNNIKIEDTYIISKKSLEKLYFEAYNKSIENAHNALNDVLATFNCYKYLIK
jgi:DNA polymerase III epsilon subunit-like protein